MKQPKKLTYESKKWLSKHNIDPTNWMLQSENNECYIYVNKVNGEIKIRNK